jgi:uncharacterized protein (DUF488 family)
MHFYTIGHSRHSTEQLLQLLEASRVTKLVDVRRSPFSRFNPQFNRDRLADSLLRHGIAYWHLEELGGLRDPASNAHSANTAWRNPFLRSYADYAQTKPFRDALQALCQAAEQQVCAIMCAEADWRQCHRQIISDYLILRGVDVQHMLPDGRTEQARLNPSAAVAPDGALLYAAKAAPQLPLDFDAVTSPASASSRRTS